MKNIERELSRLGVKYRMGSYGKFYIYDILTERDRIKLAEKVVRILLKSGVIGFWMWTEGNSIIVGIQKAKEGEK